MLRSGLRALLAHQAGVEVVGEANNGLELLAQLPATPADVVLLDYNMPGMNGLETTHQLREHFPAVRELVLSMLSGETFVHQMLEAGAWGYLLISAALDEIVHGIQMVASGRRFLCAEIGLSVLQKLHEYGDDPLAPARAGADPPVTPGKGELSSLPTQIPTTSSPAKPMNKASR